MAVWDQSRRQTLIDALVGEEHLGLFLTSPLFHSKMLYLAGQAAGAVEALVEGVMELEAQALLDPSLHHHD